MTPFQDIVKTQFLLRPSGRKAVSLKACTVTDEQVCIVCNLPYNRYIELHFLLGVKIIHLIDRTDLCNISNLVLGGEVVTDLYSSLEGQSDRKGDIEIEIEDQ
jgi:hypothetical protein